MDDLQSSSLVAPVSTAVLEMSSVTDLHADEGAVIVSSSALEGHMKSPDEIEPSGRTALFLRGKGFGWLLEVDDTTDDEEKPLL